VSYTFRLYLPSGDDVGTFRTLTLEWDVGDEFKAGDGNRYAIVDKVPFEDDLQFVGALVVTPAEPV
jgi:hypothetical protein